MSKEDDDDGQQRQLTFESTARKHCGGIASLVLRVGQGDKTRTLHVSRELLAVASPVFERMLTPGSGFVEAETGVVNLPDDDPDTFVELLRLIYPIGTSKITDLNVGSVLALADKYDVKTVREDCEWHLVKRTDKSGQLTWTVGQLLAIADTYHLDDLKKACMEKLLRTSREVRLLRTSDEWLDRGTNRITYQTRYEVLEYVLNQSADRHPFGRNDE